MQSPTKNHFLNMLKEEFKIWLEASEYKGAGIFFTDGELFLALKYPKNNHGGLWTLPGGGKEDGETPLETAKREAKEEVGSCPGKQFDKIIERNGEWISFLYEVKQFLPEISDEHEEYAWLPINNIKDIKFHPKVQEVLPLHFKKTKVHFNKNETGDLNGFFPISGEGDPGFRSQYLKRKKIKSKKADKLFGKKSKRNRK